MFSLSDTSAHMLLFASARLPRCPWRSLFASSPCAFPPLSASCGDPFGHFRLPSSQLVAMRPTFPHCSNSLQKVVKRGGIRPPRAAAPSEKVVLEQHVPLFAFGTFSKVGKRPCSASPPLPHIPLLFVSARLRTCPGRPLLTSSTHAFLPLSASCGGPFGHFRLPPDPSAGLFSNSLQKVLKREGIRPLEQPPLGGEIVLEQQALPFAFVTFSKVSKTPCSASPPLPHIPLLFVSAHLPRCPGRSLFASDSSLFAPSTQAAVTRLGHFRLPPDPLFSTFSYSLQKVLKRGGK
jgi:hypothetical protein